MKYGIQDMRHGRQGFTLIEVMVVIVIIGILASMGVMSMRNKVAMEAVKGEVISLRAFMDEISARARAKDTSFSVSVVGDTLYYRWGSACQNAVQGRYGVSDKTIIYASAPSAIPAAFTGTYINWAATGSCIAFEPRTRIGLNPLSTNGYLTVQSKQNEDFMGMVGKVSESNKPLQFFSQDEGASWRSL